MKRTVIIVPTYNEKDTIIGHLESIVSLYPDIEVLVVDDNSPDGTGALVENFRIKHSQVALMKRQSKNGLGEAYKSALSKLVRDESIEYILTMDADGSHDPKYISPMLHALIDYDLVVGSRYVHGGGVSNWDMKRRFLSKVGNLYSRFLLNISINDLTAGFAGFSRKILQKVDITSIASDGYAYQIEFKYRMVKAGARVKEVPIIFAERIAGRSKMNYKIIIDGLFIPLRIFIHRWMLMR